MTKIFFFVCLILMDVMTTDAQTLQVGDRLPDMMLHHVISYPTRDVRLKDFNKNYLILDFSGIYCGTCISAIPKLDKIVERYKGQLQVLMVNTEPEETVKNFFKHRQIVTGLENHIPICSSDTVLSRRFKHESVPHFVWIEPGGKVFAQTGPDEITEENIRTFVCGQPIVMKQKTENMMEYDYTKPFLMNGNGGNGAGLLFHSVLTGYTQGVQPLSSVSCDDITGYQIKIFNQDIRSIYRLAYDPGMDDGGRGLFGLPTSLISFEIPDTASYYGDINGHEKKKNMYCYEIRVPGPVSFPELKAMMKTDLDRYFHLRTHIEKRITTCWVLTSDSPAMVQTKKTNPFQDINRYSVTMTNTPFSLLVLLLRHDYMASLPFPMLDETGIKGSVDLNFVADLSSPQSLDKALSTYKIHFKKKECPIDILVIQVSDKKLSVLESDRKPRNVPE